jgi:hypothetical protein
MTANKSKGFPLGIIKVKNGYMITNGNSIYETPYAELIVLNSLEEVMNHFKEHFDDK